MINLVLSGWETNKQPPPKRNFGMVGLKKYFFPPGHLSLIEERPSWLLVTGKNKPG